MSGFEVRTKTSVEDGVFKRGKLKFPDLDIKIPAKTTPVKRITSQDEVYPSTRSVAEVYQTVDATEIRASINDNDPSFVDSLKGKQKFVREDELNVVLIDYTDTGAMSAGEAQEIAEIINNISDVITTPLQTPLLHAMIDDDKENPVDDSFYNYKITKENFFDAAATLDNEKPIMGTLSFLSDRHLNQLLKLYEDFEVNIFGIDFYNSNLTGEDCNSLLCDLIGRITALDLFSGSVLYAYNMNKLQYRKNADIHTAENFAPVGMGFDIIGDNHIGLGFSPEGEQQNFNVFDPDVVGYQPIPVDKVTEEWPVTVQSNIPPDRIDSLQPDKANELVSLVNSEQMQLSLNKLRERIEEGNESNFLKMKEGIGERMKDAFENVREAYRGGSAPGVTDY